MTYRIRGENAVPESGQKVQNGFNGFISMPLCSFNDADLTGAVKKKKKPPLRAEEILTRNIKYIFVPLKNMLQCC